MLLLLRMLNPCGVAGLECDVVLEVIVYIVTIRQRDNSRLAGQVVSKERRIKVVDRINFGSDIIGVWVCE
jgi:hypothetical protein